MRRTGVILLTLMAILVLTVGTRVRHHQRPAGWGRPSVCGSGCVRLLPLDVPAWRCSGSLIAPDVVLTAGHCTDGAVAARVWFDEDVTYDNVPFPLYPYGGPGSGAVEGTAYTYSDFCTGCGNGLPQFAHGDVGIVVLDEAV